MFLTANSDKTEIGSLGQYKVRTNLQEDGNLTIGLNWENCSGNWIAFDRFELQFYGDPLKAYQDLLDASVTEAQALIDGAAGDAISATAKAAWQAVVDANDNHDKAFDEESDFTTAIANIEAANTSYQAMASPYATWLKVKAGADAMALVSNNNAEATTTLTGAVSTQNTAAEAALTATDLNTAISTLRTAIKTFINATEPTAGNNFEITCLVENPSFDDNTITGWTRNITKSGGNAQTTYTCNEFWNNTFDFYQDLEGLPNGSYQLSVQAFSRPGGNNVAYPAYVGGTNSVTAELYVNSDASTVGNIYAYNGNTSEAKVASGGFADYKCVVEGGTDYWVPNGMEGASLYFANENVYKTTVAALVEDGNLKIGFRDATFTADQWTIFDNFRLYYYGSDKTVYYEQYLPQLIAEVTEDKSNGLYANVTGKELSDLNNALGVDASGFTTEDEYSDAINAIKNAQSAYRAAYPSYDALVAAKAYADLTEITANIGTGVFQYPTTTPDLWTAYSDAKDDVDDYVVSTSSTAAAVQTLVDALDDAIEAYNSITLNAPADGNVFNVMITTGDDYAFKNNPLTFNADNESGAYFGKNVGVKAHLAQQITFTKVEGNKYTLSMVNADGNTVYVRTNATDKGGDGTSSQIRLTTTPANALAVEIVPTSTDGVYNLRNTEANALLGCQDNPAERERGGLFTCGAHNDFTITAATKPSVNVNVTAANKYGTRIYPFKPTKVTGLKYYSCEAASGNTLTLVEVDGDLAANTPYIVENTTDPAATVDDTQTGYGTATADNATAGWLTGVYTDTYAEDGWYVLQNNNSTVGFYLVDRSVATPTVGAYRCYLTIGGGGSAKAFFFPGDDEATLIEGLDALTAGEYEAIYTMGGVKVNALQKGTNIVQLKSGNTIKVNVK